MSEELEAGTLVGRYQLLFRLGKGGMGEVWAAAQTQSEFGFQKLIALKVLRTRELTSQAAVMFMDEANAASALQHQAIVSTVDLGREDDIMYIAMDMVRGPSLTAVLQRLVINQRQMSPAIVAHIGEQIASALDYGHDRARSKGQLLKLVHRDVSPHNVLVDLNGSIKLTDFGVARTTIQSHQSHVGTVRGKPSYMAPEQVAGADIDARTDLFALGIVLYESACLKRLFGRSNPVKSMDAVIKHTPRPLPELKPGFPEELWAVIRKALEKDPKDRFQSPAEMRDALEAASHHLDGAGSASRDLVELVNKNFEPDAFDIDARVKEVLAEVGPAIQSPGLPAARVAEADAPVIKGIELPVNGHNMAWPTAHAPDPLAPEAIEEARTQFRALTPSASVALGMQSMSLDQYTPSYVDVTPALTHTGMLPAPQKRRWLVPALALSTAAILMAGTVFVVMSARTPAVPEQTVEPRAEVEPPPAVASPGVSQKQPPPPPPVKHVVTEAPPPVAPPDPGPTSPRKNKPKKNPKTEPTKNETTKPEDATYSEVARLVTQVKNIDPARGRAMYPTLLEAGRGGDTAVLNRLRREAQQILQSKETNKDG